MPNFTRMQEAYNRYRDMHLECTGSFAEDRFTDEAAELFGGFYNALMASPNDPRWDKLCQKGPAPKPIQPASRDNETIPDIIADLMSENRRFSNSVAFAIASRLKDAYKREIDIVRPFVRDAEAAYSEAILFSANEDVEKDVICRQGAAQEWLNNHPQEEKNDGPR